MSHSDVVEQARVLREISVSIRAHSRALRVDAARSRRWSRSIGAERALVEGRSLLRARCVRAAACDDEQPDRAKHAA